MVAKPPIEWRLYYAFATIGMALIALPSALNGDPATVVLALTILWLFFAVGKRREAAGEIPSALATTMATFAVGCGATTVFLFAIGHHVVVECVVSSSTFPSATP